MILRFVVSLALTAVLVLVTARLGRLGRRRAHLALAALSLASFTYTVILAEALGRAFDLPRTELRIHLVFANLGLAALLGVIATGTRLFLREEARRRRWHRRMVGAFLVFLTLATATGSWVLTGARPRSANPAQDAGT